MRTTKLQSQAEWRGPAKQSLHFWLNAGSSVAGGTKAARASPCVVASPSACALRAASVASRSWSTASSVCRLQYAELRNGFRSHSTRARWMAASFPSCVSWRMSLAD